MSGLEEFLTPEITGLAVAALVMLAVGGIIYSLFQPALSGSKRRDQRVNAVAARPQSENQRKALRDVDRRKRSIQDQLKEFEVRQKAKQDKQQKVSLKVKIEQAGLAWETHHFVIFSIVAGLVFLILGLIFSGNLLIAAAFGFAGTLGFPRWYVSSKRKRRFKRVSRRVAERRRHHRARRQGRSTTQRLHQGGCPRSPRTCRDRVPQDHRNPDHGDFACRSGRQVARTSSAGRSQLLCIVVAIQQKAGGGLAEALNNLSKVLRGRKAMKRKIKALSAEAKSSAGIIGSLPFFVGGIMYLISPNYILVLFETTAGNIIIAGCLFWMFCGIMVMRAMINFDF